MGMALIYNIPAMIAYQARARTAHAALIEGRDTLSYGALERQVCRWSSRFAALGLTPGDRIGLCLTDTSDHVIAMLAAMRAQLPFLSLDWKSTRQDVESRAAKLNLKLVLCHSERNLPSRVGVLCDDGWRAEIARAPESFPLPALHHETTALLAASSGTTGTPGVVRVSHGALFARAVGGNWLTHSPDATDRVLRALPMAYTLGRGFNFSYFCSGCTSVLMPSLYGPEEYLDAIERHGISHANANPTILKWLVDHVAEVGRRLSGLKVLGCTGSTLSPDLKRELVARVTPNLFEKYGAVATGVMTVARPEDIMSRPTSVGRPEFGVDLEVVDDGDNPVPVGTVGTVRCRSPQAADPIEVDHDGAGETGRRGGYWYTDDRGRFDEDGYLYLAGRSSSLIIRASVNIFAEELEEVIRTHPGVSDVAVLGRASADAGEEPVALVVLRQARGSSERELIAYCRQRLSGNKSPAGIFFVDELPRALGGKIKRAALPGLLRALTDEAAAADRAPEQRMA